MSGGFGRKGVGVGPTVDRSIRNTASPQPRFAGPPRDDDDGLSPEARAFIAAERARKPQYAPSFDPMADAVGFASPGSELDRTLRPIRPARSLLLAYVYWWFAGILGAYRFYLGEYRSAMLMPLLFFGGLLVMLVTPLPGVAMICICVGWNLVDGFLIPGMYRRYGAERRSAEMAHVFS